MDREFCAGLSAAAFLQATEKTHWRGGAAFAFAVWSSQVRN